MQVSSVAVSARINTPDPIPVTGNFCDKKCMSASSDDRKRQIPFTCLYSLL